MGGRTRIPLHRILYIEDRPDLGQSHGPDRFSLNWEFLLQLDMLFDGLAELRPRISAEKASGLADFIEGQRGEKSWGIHLAVWGDEKGVVVGEFVKFLRGGGFVVVNADQ